MPRDAGIPPHNTNREEFHRKKKGSTHSTLTFRSAAQRSIFPKSQVLHPSTRKLAAGAATSAGAAAPFFPWSRHNGATKYRNRRDTNGERAMEALHRPLLFRPTAPPDSTSLRTATVVQRRHMAASMDHGGRTPFSPRRTARVGQQMAQQVARGRGAARMGRGLRRRLAPRLAQSSAQLSG